MRSQMALICAPLALLCCALAVSPVQAQTEPTAAEALAASTKAQEHAFLLFWRTNDAATQAAVKALETGLESVVEPASIIDIQVTDPANAALVKKYDLSRAPMPLILAVAPTGAVTAVFQQGKCTPAQVQGAIVTKTMAYCMKALQEDKLVLIAIVPQGARPALPGVDEFIADPEFQARTVAVALELNNPKEARFYKDLEVSAKETAPQVAFLAPPGVLVGKFPGNVTKAMLAEKLHESGKCCDDPNCKHNHATKPAPSTVK